MVASNHNIISNTISEGSSSKGQGRVMGIAIMILFCFAFGGSVLGAILPCDAVPEITFYNSKKTTKTKTQNRISLQPTTTSRKLFDILLVSRGGGQDDTNNDGSVPSPAATTTTTTIEQVEKEDSMSVEDNAFQILDETTVYSGWRTIVQRKVRMRNGRVVTFDLVGVKTSGAAVMIFAWDTTTKTVTMVREYMPASNRVMWGLAAGIVEAKHDQHNPELAARHELEEECHLKNGRWISLCDVPSSMDKYSTTVVHCYLVLDPEKEDNPRPLDDEEDIEIVSGVTIPHILQWIQTGEINLVSGFGCLLAIEKLRELGEYE